jgi:arylsulfatase A-like enzyme
VLDGVDLSALLLHGFALPKRTLFWEKGGSGVARRGVWKYILQGKAEQLYNLEEDLAETQNVAQKYPEIFQQLKQEYRQWNAEVTAHPTGPQIDPNVSATPLKKEKNPQR